MPGFKGHLALKNAPGCSRILAQPWETSTIKVSSIPGEQKVSKHLFFSVLSAHVVAVHKEAAMHAVFNRWKKKRKGISKHVVEVKEEEEKHHILLGLQAGLCQENPDLVGMFGLIKPKKHLSFNGWKLHIPNRSSRTRERKMNGPHSACQFSGVLCDHCSGLSHAVFLNGSDLIVPFEKQAFEYFL